MGPVTRVRATRRAARSPQAAPTRTATTRRSSCRPEGPAGGTRYRTFSADMPKLASPTCRIVSRRCPLTQIILLRPTAGRIRIYRAPRNSTADVRLRSGSCCRDILGLLIIDDDDDEGAMEARIVSVNRVLEHSLAHVTAIECIDERLTRVNDESHMRFVVY